MRSFPIRATALLLVVLFAGAVRAEDRGYFGFALKVVTRGFFLAPTVSELGIERVVPGTPAERAGIRAGDRILEVEGKPVAGNKALELKARAARQVGQTLRLTLRHPDGQVYRVAMVAVPHPAE
ncbi:MAG: PDZ domain-containing protein [Lysobacteraceae bacterium]